jgi:hypothetical protein
MDTNKTDDKQGQSQNESSRKPIITQEGGTNKQHTEESTNNTKKKKSITTQLREQRIHVMVTLIFDFLLFLATTTYATFSYLQWRTMNEQLGLIRYQTGLMTRQSEIAPHQSNALDQQAKTMSKQTQVMSKQSEILSKQLIFGERAWVTAKDAYHNEFKTGEQPQAVVAIINAGNTPARNLTIYGNIQWRDKPIPTPMIFLPLPSTGQEPSFSVIAPNEGMNISFSDIPVLTDDIIKLAREQKIHLYVWGKIDYDDIFGKHHKTEFCFVDRFYARVFATCSNNNTIE